MILVPTTLFETHRIQASPIIPDNDALISAGLGHVGTLAAQLGTQGLVLEKGWGA